VKANRPMTHRYIVKALSKLELLQVPRLTGTIPVYGLESSRTGFSRVHRDPGHFFGKGDCGSHLAGRYVPKNMELGA
jgi:hypothetical protein